MHIFFISELCDYSICTLPREGSRVFCVESRVIFCKLLNLLFTKITCSRQQGSDVEPFLSAGGCLSRAAHISHKKTTMPVQHVVKLGVKKKT